MNELTPELLKGEQIKKIPATSFMRMWCLGNSQARIAAHFLSYYLRRNFLHGDARQQALNQTKLKAAMQLLGTMGYLRGAIMKVGQLFANLPQLAGLEFVEVFESLQFEAPPMHYSLVREVFLDELGKEPEEIFASFERRAFAAASLGQVHRARLHDGSEVAVKIQYPDIARTINADLKALGFLVKTMRLKKDLQYLHDHIHDAREVFLREVDYLNEAGYMERNRKIFEGTEIVVPNYYPELTTQKVLTMEYLPGQSLQAFLADNPSQNLRNHYGILISRSLIHSYFRFRTIYADLHPGNYLFMADGRLGFIDFGCFQQFSQGRWQFQMEFEEALIAKDRDKILHFLAKITFHESIDQMSSERAEMMFRQVGWMVKPVTSGGPFNFAEKTYAEEGVNLLKEILDNGGNGPMDCFYNWTNRAIFGHRSLMYRLKSNFDYGAMFRDEMDRAMS